MEIPKFGISRLVFFSDHNRMILTDVQSDPPAKFRPKPPISERAALCDESVLLVNLYYWYYLVPARGLLGGMGGEAAGVDGSGEGAWTLAAPAEGCA